MLKSFSSKFRLWLEAFKGVEFNIEATWSPWDPFDLLIGAWIYVPGDEDPNPLVAGVVQAEFTF